MALRYLTVLLIGLCCWASLNALELVTPAKTSYDGIQGGKTTLECKYTLAPEDTGTLDIEWTLVAADSQQADQMIISYNTGVVYQHIGPLKDRVHFSSTDPVNGDGSIEIVNLQESDTGAYQCKVKKLPGAQNMKMRLTVYITPGKTRCFVDGKQEIGSDLTLKCDAKEGSAPVTYSWEKISGVEKLPPSTSDASGAVLSIKNASQAFSGTYRCTSRNRVGTDECLLILNVVPPTNTAGIIAGAIIGTLLFLIILGILIFCCCRKQKEKKYEKEIQHEIREDVAPPKSRTSTARSYIGSNHSSLGSLSPSNMDGYSKARYNHVPSEEHERPASQNPSFLAPKVAGPNLSRMGAIPVMIPAQNKDGSIV